jgi:hypothetical protein
MPKSVFSSGLRMMPLARERLRLHYLIPFDRTSQFEFVQRLQFLPTNIAPAFLSPLNVHMSQFDATFANSPPTAPS